MKQKDINKLLLDIRHFDLGKYNKVKRIIIDALLIAVGILWVFLAANFFGHQNKTYDAIFISCVDGDTVNLTVNYKDESVRLLAVNTPEITEDSEFYGQDASIYTCRKVENAKHITVELDNNADKYDKYGRLLAWVFVDGKLLQEGIIEGGYGKVAYLYGDYKYTEKLQSLERIAKENQKGIWVR